MRRFLILTLAVSGTTWPGEMLSRSALAQVNPHGIVATVPVVRVKTQFQASAVGLNRIYFSPDGKTLVTASADGVATLWDLQGQALARLSGQKPPMFNARFSPDGSVILTTGYDGTVWFWNRNGDILRKFQAHRAAMADAILSPDAQILVTCSDDGQTLIFNRAGMRLASIIKPGTARNLAYSSATPLIASVSDSGTLHLLKPNGELKQSVATGQGRINHVRFSPKGNYVITAGTDGTAKLWDLEGNLILKLQVKNSGWVNGADFHRQGVYVATASDDGILRLWNVDGRLMQSLPLGKNNKLTSLNFSQDGKQLAVTSNKGQVWILDVSL